MQGAPFEGGWRFYMECLDFVVEDGTSRLHREWVPLCHQPAGLVGPIVFVRWPLQPAKPPAPVRAYAAGDRVEVLPLPLFVTFDSC